ncbi:MAG TPA: FHA domain-containing protein [Planctomycetaceae bacterium]|nr:FHA domain-containing protein [Planctomycetaceae bacterium]
MIALVYIQFDAGTATMLAQLIPQEGGPPITLHNPITVVGRSSKMCDLVVDHTSISKQHCVLVKTDGLLYLRDLGSTNGTRVNGQRVIRGALLPGDQIAFSSITYRVHLGPDQGHARVARDGATEMIPVIRHDGVDEDTINNEDASKSDVRFLRDSDLLQPD